MGEAREQIIDSLNVVLQALGERLGPTVDHPANTAFGDYSTNIALVLAKKLGKNPMELAQQIKKSLEQRAKSKEQRALEKIEVVPPGFINFWLSKEYLSRQLERLISLDEKTGKSHHLKDKKILVEFAHPNTHKEFHIGHLRNVTLGEVVCRLLLANGAVVRRVNYQGDVGLHVAKALYGLLQNSEFRIQNSEFDGKPLEEKVKLLGQVYALGSKAYEEDVVAKEAIISINKQIYTRDEAIIPLWEKTRQWSLDYFEAIYKRLGTTFERLYFESEVYKSGKKIVLSHIDDGIFTQDGGAVIFDGEKYGLHKRVFITQEGNPTYEAKEMGLGRLQYKEFPFNLAIHIVGPEQAGYFAVTFKALELIDSRFLGKERHLAYGLVALAEGKMSSRMGNVIAGQFLLDETKRMLHTQFSEMPDEVLEQVAVGAVKYSMLKVGLTQNIRFSFKESISLEGNSGPYIQYTFARAQSVLNKSRIQNLEFRISLTTSDVARLKVEEVLLLRMLHRFPEIVEEAATQFAPNFLCNYLFELAQMFNLFYQKHPILQSQESKFRLTLTEAVGKILKRGLFLLGIAAPERM